MAWLVRTSKGRVTIYFAALFAFALGFVLYRQAPGASLYTYVLGRPTMLRASSGADAHGDVIADDDEYREDREDAREDESNSDPDTNHDGIADDEEDSSYDGPAGS